MTPPLQPLQAWFQTATTNAAALEVALAAAAQLHGFGARAELEEVVTRGPQLSAFERLAIYHSGYQARLVECLADDYPALAHALGGERFETLARDYIAEHPSRSATLNAFGRHLSDFWRQSQPGGRAFFAELASLEWALVEAVHAESSEPLSMSKLEALSPERFASARIVPSATLRVLRFQYPVNDYYVAFRQGLAPAVPEPAETAVAMYRRDFTLWRRDLTRPAARVLQALVSGQTLTAALSELDAFPELAAADVMRWFSGWIAEGLFSAILGE